MSDAPADDLYQTIVLDRAPSPPPRRAAGRNAYRPRRQSLLR